MGAISDTQLIKAETYQQGKVRDVLEALGIHNVKLEGGKRWVGALPDGDNARSVQVTNDVWLMVNIYTRGLQMDILGLIAYLVFDKQTEDGRRQALPIAKKWLKEKIGWENKRISIPFSVKNSIKEAVFKENKVLDDTILAHYEAVQYAEWYREGISAQTQQEFGVAVDVYAGRVVFPVHNAEGKLISVKGRTVMGDSSKYLYLHPIEKSLELFNFHRAKPYILESKQVILFEGEKSVMLAWQYGFAQSVALGGKDVSLVQAQRIRQLGSDIEVILAFDKGIDGKYVAAQARKFLPLRVSAVYDALGVLDDRMAPIERGKEIFLQLFEKRFVFNRKVSQQ